MTLLIVFAAALLVAFLCLRVWVKRRGWKTSHIELRRLRESEKTVKLDTKVTYDVDVVENTQVVAEDTTVIYDIDVVEVVGHPDEDSA